MGSLIPFLQDQSKELDRIQNEQVEVYGDTLENSLRLAAKHLKKQVHELDYVVLKRGKKNSLVTNLGIFVFRFFRKITFWMS